MFDIKSNGASSKAFWTADTAADDVSVWYSVPSEGTVIWFDMMGIPADAASVKLNGILMEGPGVGRVSLRSNPFGAVHVVDQFTALSLEL